MKIKRILKNMAITMLICIVLIAGALVAICYPNAFWSSLFVGFIYRAVHSWNADHDKL